MAQTRSRSRLWAVVPLAVLVFAAWQTAATLSRTPAFNRSLRVEAATGGTLAPIVWANYDRADYYYEIARGWSVRHPPEPDPDDEEALEQAKEIMRENARWAQDIGYRSLRRSPGDSATWLLVANAEFVLGNREAALRGYGLSHERAPYNGVLAAERVIFLVSFMADEANWELALSTIDPNAVRSDLETMKVRFEWLSDIYGKSAAIGAILRQVEDGT